MPREEVTPEERIARKKAWYREYWLKKNYGITQADFLRMLAEQNGGCDICARPDGDGYKEKLHVDHNHTTGKVRGLLCYFCNAGLGNFMENEARLAKAVEYLRKHK